MENDSDLATTIKTGVKVAGEFFIPGGSNLVKGDIKQAGLHAVLGIAARAVFGPIGLLVVCANSFTKATTGHHLHEHLENIDNSGEMEPVRVRPTTTSTKTP